MDYNHKRIASFIFCADCRIRSCATVNEGGGKRDKFALRTALCIAGALILCPLYAVFYVYLNDYIFIISIFWYTLITVYAGAVIAVCFKINATSLFWLMIAAYAVEHLVYVIVNEIIFIGIADFNLFSGEKVGMFWLMLAVYSVVCAGVYYAFYRLFKPNIKYLGNYFLKDTWNNRIFFGVFLLIFFGSTMLNQQNAQNISNELNYLSAVSDLINCLFVLIVQFIGLTTSRINFEKQFSDKLLEDEKRQYEAFRKSVDYVNIKCHDLKHELQRIRQSGSVNTEALEEIAQGVALYEAFANTGNETLDILLTEKTLECESDGIAFSFMADAAALSVMDASDIYSLFGNLLDNAIGYVKKLDDKDKRFIRLFVKPQGGMILIHEENYFEGVAVFVEGLPQTTKDDKIYHGFGIKSMQRTAKKYGGDIRISTDDGMYKADILIHIK